MKVILFSSMWILDTKLIFCMFYITVHRLLARVQSPTCITYWKFLLESIMTVLTPKLGIETHHLNIEDLCQLNNQYVFECSKLHKGWKKDTPPQSWSFIHMRNIKDCVLVNVLMNLCWGQTVGPLEGKRNCSEAYLSSKRSY